MSDIDVIRRMIEEFAVQFEHAAEMLELELKVADSKEVRTYLEGAIDTYRGLAEAARERLANEPALQ